MSLIKNLENKISYLNREKIRGLDVESELKANLEVVLKDNKRIDVEIIEIEKAINILKEHGM